MNVHGLGPTPGHHHLKKANEHSSPQHVHTASDSTKSELAGETIAAAMSSLTSDFITEQQKESTDNKAHHHGAIASVINEDVDQNPLSIKGKRATLHPKKSRELLIKRHANPSANQSDTESDTDAAIDTASTLSNVVDSILGSAAACVKGLNASASFLTIGSSAFELLSILRDLKDEIKDKKSLSKTLKRVEGLIKDIQETHHDQLDKTVMTSLETYVNQLKQQRRHVNKLIKTSVGEAAVSSVPLATLAAGSAASGIAASAAMGGLLVRRGSLKRSDSLSSLADISDKSPDLGKHYDRLHECVHSFYSEYDSRTLQHEESDLENLETSTMMHHEYLTELKKQDYKSTKKEGDADIVGGVTAITGAGVGIGLAAAGLAASAALTAGISLGLAGVIAGSAALYSHLSKKRHDKALVHAYNQSTIRLSDSHLNALDIPIDQHTALLTALTEKGYLKDGIIQPSLLSLKHEKSLDLGNFPLSPKQKEDLLDLCHHLLTTDLSTDVLRDEFIDLYQHAMTLKNHIEKDSPHRLADCEAKLSQLRSIITTIFEIEFDYSPEQTHVLLLNKDKIKPHVRAARKLLLKDSPSFMKGYLPSDTPSAASAA